MIVNSQSADPGNVQPIPLDANHIEISKPSNRQSLLYLSVTSFLRDVFTEQRMPLAELADYRDRMGIALNRQFPPTGLYFPLSLKLTKASTALEQPALVTPDESLTTLLRSERRVYLR